MSEKACVRNENGNDKDEKEWRCPGRDRDRRNHKGWVGAVRANGFCPEEKKDPDAGRVLACNPAELDMTVRDSLKATYLAPMTIVSMRKMRSTATYINAGSVENARENKSVSRGGRSTARQIAQRYRGKDRHLRPRKSARVVMVPCSHSNRSRSGINATRLAAM